MTFSQITSEPSETLVLPCSPEFAPISLQGLQQLGKVGFGSISGSVVIPEKESVNKQAERASAGPAWSPRTDE